MLERLYVLRDQIVHGGATWNCSVNRAQVKDGSALLEAILPVIVDVMIDDQSDDFLGVAVPLLKIG